MLIETNRCHWFPTVPVGVDRRDDQNGKHGIWCFTTTLRLLMQYIESAEARRVLAKYRHFLNLWLAWFGALIKVDKNGTELVTVPTIGGSFLWTAKSARRNVGLLIFLLNRQGNVTILRLRRLQNLRRCSSVLHRTPMCTTVLPILRSWLQP